MPSVHVLLSHVLYTIQSKHLVRCIIFACSLLCDIVLLQARTLMELTRALYTTEDYKMVLDLNHQPTAFDFDALLRKMNIGNADSTPPS